MVYKGLTELCYCQLLFVYLIAFDLYILILWYLGHKSLWLTSLLRIISFIRIKWHSMHFTVFCVGFDIWGELLVRGFCLEVYTRLLVKKWTILLFLCLNSKILSFFFEFMWYLWCWVCVIYPFIFSVSLCISFKQHTVSVFTIIANLF